MLIPLMFYLYRYLEIRMGWRFVFFCYRSEIGFASAFGSEQSDGNHIQIHESFDPAQQVPGRYLRRPRSVRDQTLPVGHSRAGGGAESAQKTRRTDGVVSGSEGQYSTGACRFCPLTWSFWRCSKRLRTRRSTRQGSPRGRRSICRGRRPARGTWDRRRWEYPRRIRRASSRSSLRITRITITIATTTSTTNTTTVITVTSSSSSSSSSRISSSPTSSNRTSSSRIITLSSSTSNTSSTSNSSSSSSSCRPRLRWTRWSPPAERRPWSRPERELRPIRPSPSPGLRSTTLREWSCSRRRRRPW